MKFIKRANIIMLLFECDGMCDLWGFLKTHSLFVMGIGIILFIVSSFYQTVFPLLLLIVWWIGLALIFIGIIGYIANLDTPKKLWKIFFRLMVLIGILLGIPIMLNQMDPTSIRSILNAYLPVDTAILCITLALLTIDPNKIIQSLKTNNMINIERFKSFIATSGFVLLLIIFYYILTYFPTNYPLTATILGVTLYAFNTLFWVITFFTLILIADMIFYVAIIIDEIFNKTDTANRAILEIDKTTQSVMSGDLVKIEGNKPYFPYLCMRIFVNNIGRNAAKKCKGYFVTESDRGRICWSSSNERSTISINPGDRESLDFCAFPQGIENNKILIIPTENGWDKPYRVTLLEPVSSFKVRITAENAEMVECNVTIYRDEQRIEIT
jgi:hypothetical protein